MVWKKKKLPGGLLCSGQCALGHGKARAGWWLGACLPHSQPWAKLLLPSSTGAALRDLGGWFGVRKVAAIRRISLKAELELRSALMRLGVPQFPWRWLQFSFQLPSEAFREMESKHPLKTCTGNSWNMLITWDSHSRYRIFVHMQIVF